MYEQYSVYVDLALNIDEKFNMFYRKIELVFTVQILIIVKITIVYKNIPTYMITLLQNLFYHIKKKSFFIIYGLKNQLWIGV